jgi:hypothetical protein
MVFQRERSDALSGCREDRVEDGWGGYEDRRLADAAPEPTRWHNDAVHLGHLADPHRIIAVEVSLLNTSAFTVHS